MDKSSMQKTDWWKISGWVWIGTGLLGIAVKLSQGNIAGMVVGGGLNVLVGLGLLQRSKTVFWIVFILTILGLITELPDMVKVGGASVSLVVRLVPFVPMVMLWQQIRKEKGKK